MEDGETGIAAARERRSWKDPAATSSFRVMGTWWMERREGWKSRVKRGAEDKPIFSLPECT